MFFCWKGRMWSAIARKKTQARSCRRLSGSPEVCFGQASGFACGMPFVSPNFQSILVWNCAKTQKALHALPAGALLIVVDGC